MNCDRYKKLVKQLKTDSLTNYITRTFFDKMMKKKVESLLQKYGGTVVFYDVNNLKLMNSFGYDVGDKYLKFIADSIKKKQGYGLYVRNGGDEFVSIHFNAFKPTFSNCLYTCSFAYLFPDNNEKLDDVLRQLGREVQMKKRRW